MAINGPSVGIDEVFLTMIPSMGIEIFDHKNSFNLAMFKISTKLSPFKFFSLFRLCLRFRGCPNILFGNEVIHSYPYYLSLWKTGFCWFSKEKTPNFLIQFLHVSTYSQISTYFRYFFFLQADGFLSNWSSISSHFPAKNCNFAKFFIFFEQFKDKAPK